MSQQESQPHHGGHILLRSLMALGAKHGFGVPGESYLAALDAMVDGGFDFTLCRNEGGAAFMASAYGKLTGEPGICFVTRGPGATNAAIGIHTAHQDSSPLLLFVGQVGTDQLGREAFQEVDYKAVFGGLAKWVVQIDDIDRLPEIVSRAYAMALSGRPGPVVIALPEDMLSSQSDVPAAQPVSIPQPAASEGDIQAVLAAIAQAERPVIIAGGSGWDAGARDDLRAFAEALSLPVAAAFRYHDVMDNHSSSYIGDAGVAMNEGLAAHLQEADLILALNIRFGEMTTKAWSLFDVPRMTPMLIHSHLCADEINKIYQADIALNAAPQTLLAQLLQASEGQAPLQAHQDWCQKARQTYEAGLIPPQQDSKVNMAEVIQIIEELTPQDAIITHGAGNFAIWPDKYMRFGTRRLLAPQSGAMGYGLPAAIAACKVTGQNRKVICFAGDGDIQMNLPELGTAMQHRLTPIILVFNNGSYGTIRMHQETQYPHRISGTELENPDFMTLASAYGFAGAKVTETSEFRAIFETALNSDKGIIIELLLDIEAISPRTTISRLRERSYQ